MDIVTEVECTWKEMMKPEMESGSEKSPTSRYCSSSGLSVLKNPGPYPSTQVHRITKRSAEPSLTMELLYVKKLDVDREMGSARYI